MGVHWNEESDALLTELWATSMCCSQIGDQLHTTKSAVIGRARRLYLPNRKKGPKALSADERKQRERERHERWRRSIGILPRGTPRPPSDPVIAVEDESIPMSQRIFECHELQNQHCRWPVGEPGKFGFFFCGAPEADLQDRRPYCRTHTQRAIAPRLPKKVLEAA